jgi:hypothetical protein
MNNMFAAVMVACWSVIIVIIVIIVFGVTISYHEKQIVDQYISETEIGYNTSIEKLDKILLLLIKLENNKNGTNCINRR